MVYESLLGNQDPHLLLTVVGSEEVVDFRKLHCDVCEKLLSLCEVWEGKGCGLEDDSQISNLEEGVGHWEVVVVCLLCWFLHARSAGPGSHYLLQG